MKTLKNLTMSALLFTIGAIPAFALEPWIITTDIVVNEAMEVGDVIIAGGGSLKVVDVPEPGFRVAGNVWAISDGQVFLRNSVIEFLSTYNGQYTLVGIDQARIEITGCTYRVPSAVLHGVVIGGEGQLIVEDTDFDPVQLVSSENAHLTARRLNGNFEVLVQHDSDMVLEDIPRDAGKGIIWVWVEFPVGSEAEYSPPMPGFIDSWTFPPQDSAGIDQTVTVSRCETLLWAMLVREKCRLTLRDINEDNWVVVGFFMPFSTRLSGLRNNTFYDDTTLDLSDREIRLVNTSIDTWNLYPEEQASIVVSDSLLGEVLSFDTSSVRIERTTIDGTGGYFGARDNSHIRAFDSVFTCTIEAAQDTTIELHNCSAEPYPLDATGEFTRFGAYDRARLLADMTPVYTTPALGDQGIIAVTAFADPPALPPAGSTMLQGSAAIFSLDEAPTLKSWQIEVIPSLGGLPEFIAEGVTNVEEDEFGVWSNANPNYDHLLRIILTDSLGRTFEGVHRVLGTASQIRDPNPGRRVP